VIEQLLIGRRRFLQPIEVLQIAFGVLDGRGRVGRARLLVAGDYHRRVQRHQARLAGEHPRQDMCDQSLAMDTLRGDLQGRR
jgi:hypothetical protein